MAIARVIDDELKERAKANKVAGTKHYWAVKNGEVNLMGESPTKLQNLARASASAAVGMCDQRYRQAKEVVEAAEADAANFGDIVETMDATNNVRGADQEDRALCCIDGDESSPSIT